MPPSATDTSSLLKAMNYVPQAVAVFDSGLRLIVSNERYNDLLLLPADLRRPGTGLFDIALYMADRGDFGPGDAARLAVERINTLTAGIYLEPPARRWSGRQLFRRHGAGQGRDAARAGQPDA